MVVEAIVKGQACGICQIYLPGKAPGHERYCSDECADEANAPHELIVDEEEWEGL